MIERLFKLIRKSKNELESDLTPRGIARTVADERTDFNSTFQHQYKERMYSAGLKGYYFK